MASADRDALLALYRPTGLNWGHKHNWGTDAALSRWDGVNVNGEGRVVKLNLNWSYLRGMHMFGTTLRTSRLALLRCIWPFSKISLTERDPFMKVAIE